MVCDKCYLVDEHHCVGGNSTPGKEAACFSDALIHIYQATRCHIIQLAYFLPIVNIFNLASLNCKAFKCIIFLFYLI